MVEDGYAELLHVEALRFHIRIGLKWVVAVVCCYWNVTFKNDGVLAHGRLCCPSRSRADQIGTRPLLLAAVGTDPRLCARS